ncbi:uncharacterized protein LOC123266980 [Cotesia glomerata]|uniref:CHK kinase-like domain-containing protein n=1 Tax=Cotesia glomerata TaxID=32391 RepID=A0AAV7HWW7_COTGL|nr:uncharacterized protein LOC123266980 [Cotesia glomerata]KAH0534817.1 hypothetical protein KQX54_008901 [Cotesia glomerata]
MTKPAWLTAEFIERVLRDADENYSISMTNIEVKLATSKGDNYCSEMYRVYFDLTCDDAGKRVSKNGTILVKVASTDLQIHKELVEDINIFDNEIKMMTCTLKDMELVLKDTKLSGRCYYTQRSNPPVLVLEDLAPLGFRMADRQNGLDLCHSVLAIRRLAKFHASSVFVIEKKPKVKKLYSKGLFDTRCPPELSKLFVNGVKAMTKVAESWSEVSKQCVEKLKSLQNAAYSKACEIGKLREDEFNVINHGDFWVNNMMFKYDDKGNVIDHIFVDFQICVYGTPALDLQYYLNTSLREEVLIYHKNLLIEEYQKTLSSTMKKIGCETCAPSLEYLKKILLEREFLGFVVASVSLPIMIVDRDHAQGLDELASDGEYSPKAYSNEAYKIKMVRRLKEWNDLGIFD